MKINFKNKKAMVLFSNLNPGDVFTTYNLNTYWMVLKSKDGVIVNSVNIKDGTMTYFDKAETVYPVNCTLTIED